MTGGGAASSFFWQMDAALSAMNRPMASVRMTPPRKDKSVTEALRIVND
jgi:hypothetical protein